MILNRIKREFLLRKAHAMAAKGNHDDSLEVFDRVVSMFPQDGGTYLQKAIAFLNKGDLDQAETMAVASVENQPHNPASLLYLGIIRYDLKRYGEALDAFNQVLDLSPKNNLAGCYKHLTLMALNQQTPDGLTEFKKFIRHGNAAVQSRCLVFCETFFLKNNLDPDFRGLVFKEGMPLLDILAIYQNARMKTLSLALKKLWVTLTCGFSPTKKQALMLNLDGDRHLFAGQVDAALHNFTQALGILPSLEEAEMKLIGLFHVQKNYTAIIDHFSKASGHGIIFRLANGEVAFQDLPDSDLAALDLDVLMELTFAYYQLGEYAKAVILGEIIADGCTDFLPHYLLGLCHIALGHFGEAYQCFYLSMQNLNPDVAVLTVEGFDSHQDSL